MLRAERATVLADQEGPLGFSGEQTKTSKEGKKKGVKKIVTEFQN